VDRRIAFAPNGMSFGLELVSLCPLVLSLRALHGSLNLPSMSFAVWLGLSPTMILAVVNRSVDGWVNHVMQGADVGHRACTSLRLA